MTLPLNKEMLSAAYEYLRATPPFCRWKLPEAEDVKFVVSRYRRDYAQYMWNGKQHTIALSVHGIGHTETLMIYLAHEMIHMYLEEMGWESRSPGPDVHNAAFKKFAAQVCKHHGFDLKAFM